MNRNFTSRQRRLYITKMGGLDIWLFLAVVFTVILPLVMQGLERTVE